jgi:maleate isomerase
MTPFPYRMTRTQPPAIGLIVLQADERIERDFHRLLPRDARLYVTRVPSGLDVSAETLQQMATDLPAAARLFPRPVRFAAVGYGCTSGAAQIGPARVAELVRTGTQADSVTEPVSALIAACGSLGIRQLAFLSPYVAGVSRHLRDTLQAHGIETPVFGSFDEAEEARVARISPDSISQAAEALAGRGAVDAVFLSCTNLDTLDIIDDLETRLGLPVLSSNQVLAWHVWKLGTDRHLAGPGALLA